MGNATLNEIHPRTYQHAADKARELGRYSQADNLEAGAGDGCGAEYNEPNKVHATPKSIAYINGKYSCLLARDGAFSTGGANYFSDVSTTRGYIQSKVPEEMKTRDMALARKIARWWNEYGEKDIPVLKDWHSFVNYNVYNESRINENMKKNTIKLNESTLRKVVAESVKNILSEIDWKTYANARQKASARGEHNRAMNFGNAADDAFNDEYAHEDKYGEKYGEGSVRGDTFMNTVHANSKSNGFKSPSHSIRHISSSNPYNYDDTKAFGIMDKYDEEGRYKRVKNPSLKRFFNDKEQELAFKRASKEMDDYTSGNYDYDNEKGWHLKESVLRKMIAESVKKVLKEGILLP